MGSAIASVVFVPPNSIGPQQYLKKNFAHDLHTLETDSGNKICVLFKDRGCEYTILHSHGNGEDLPLMVQGIIELENITKCNICAYDYSGYGLSTGQPSEAATYQDIDTVFKWLTNTKNISKDKIILFGRSLGSGPTINLASKVDKIGGLILQSPLRTVLKTQAQSVALLSKAFDMYKNESKISTITDCPILIIHGTLDDVVPFSHGEWLYKEFKKIHHKPDSVVCYWAQDCDHNNIEYAKGPEYNKNVYDFISNFIFSQSNKNHESDGKENKDNDDSAAHRHTEKLDGGYVMINNRNQNQKHHNNNNNNLNGEYKDDEKKFEEKQQQQAQQDRNKQSNYLYYQDLEQFQAFCWHQVKNNKNKNKNKNGNFEPASHLEIQLAGQLSKWIYSVTESNRQEYISGALNPPFMKDHHMRVVEISFQHSQNHNYNQWAVLTDDCKVNKTELNIYLAFKGSKFSDVKDILTDADVKPFPVLMDKTGVKPQISGHGGMYASVMRDFNGIWTVIKSIVDKNSSSNYNVRLESGSIRVKLYVAGHSMGGGVSILFGLESLKQKMIPQVINSKNTKIITLAPPTVVSFETENISESNENLLNVLESMTHCIVNRFDLVARIPMSIEWINKVICRMIVEGAKQFAFSTASSFKLIKASQLSMPHVFQFGVNRLDSLVDKKIDFPSYIAGMSKCLNSYEPIGTFYIFFSNFDKYCCVEGRELIKKVLNYIPNHSHMVRHFNYDYCVENHYVTNYLQLLNNLSLKEKEKEKDKEKTFDSVGNPINKIEGFIKSMENERNNGETCGSGAVWWNDIVTKYASQNVTYYLQQHKAKNTKGIRMSKFAIWSNDSSSQTNYRIICGYKTKDSNGKIIYKLIDTSDDLQKLKDKMQTY